MIRADAAVEPMLPVVGRPHEAAVRLLERLRAAVLAPAECAEDLLVLLHAVTRGCARTLETEVHVGGQTQLDFLALDVAAGPRDSFVVAGSGVLPVGRLAA